ncbi:MAG: hypothetical protein [Microviridae sp.]|nr:MAG: hypothetical protein [Microviridae sp.]
MTKKWITRIKEYFTVGESEENPFSLEYSSSDNEIVEGTPLWLTKGNEDGSTWFLTFANYKLREATNKKELIKWFRDNNFNVIMDLVVIILEMHKQKTKNHE